MAAMRENHNLGKFECKRSNNLPTERMNVVQIT